MSRGISGVNTPDTSIPHPWSDTSSSHILDTSTSDVATLDNSLVPPLPPPHHTPLHISRTILALSARPRAPSSLASNPVYNPDVPKSHVLLHAKAALNTFCTQSPPLLLVQKSPFVAAEKQTYAPVEIVAPENLCSTSPLNLCSP